MRNFFESGPVKKIVAAAGIMTVLSGVPGCKTNELNPTGVVPTKTENKTPSPVNSPKSTPKESAINSAIASVEASLTPSSTPEITLSPEEILNTRISDALNKEGDFTEEKIQKMLINVDVMNEKKGTKLGLVDVAGMPRIEGILVDLIKNDDYVGLIMEFDGTDGKPFLTELAIPMYLYDKAPSKFKINRFTQQTVKSTYTAVYEGNDRTKILEYLDLLRGKPLIFDSLVTEFPKEWTEGKWLTEYDGVVAKWANEGIDKVPLFKKLVKSVYSNGLKPKNVENIPKGTKIVDIKDVGDIEQIDMGKEVPIITNIYFYEIGESLS